MVFFAFLMTFCLHLWLIIRGLLGMFKIEASGKQIEVIYLR